MMRIIPMLTVICVTVQAKFGPDKKVCDIAQYIKNASVSRGPSKPQLPPQFTVRIESDVIDSNYTIDIQEYYDGPDNKGALHMWQGGMETKLIFLYDTNELITLEYDSAGGPPRCHVDDLVKSTDKGIFGLTTGPNGHEHMFSANYALKFGGNTSEVYLGRAVSRDGIIVDAWESCLYLDSQDTTMRLTWYFTAANGDWTSAESIITPVEADMFSITHVNSTYSYQSIKKYFLTDFKPYLFDGPVKAFQTPPGTYCPDRVSLRPLPNVTNMFSFSAEVVEPLNNYVNWIKESYDFTKKLFRYDFTPDPSSGLGSNQLVRLHDFNEGIAYVMDPIAGNCSIHAIDSGNAIDNKIVDATSLRMRTSKEFFYMDKTTYQYAGQRQVRGIPCDVFAGIRYDYPTANSTTLFEWYFASQDWMDNAGYSLTFYQPTMLQITSKDPSYPLNIIYNIYEYLEDDPQIWKTDVRACFNYTERVVYDLGIDGAGKGNISADLDGFKSAVIQSASMFAQISPLRVTDVQVDFIGLNIGLKFVVLGPPPIPGDVKTPKAAVSLAAAKSALDSIIDQGAFVVTLPNFVSLYGIRPKPVQPPQEQQR